MPKKTKSRKKKQIRTAERGRIYVTATFNNTIVTITDLEGKPLFTSSCGMYGFKGTRKSTPYAATLTVEAAVKKATAEYNMRSAVVFLKGIGPGRDAALRVLRGSDLDVEKLVDITPIPHNGVRPPKMRQP